MEENNASPVPKEETPQENLKDDCQKKISELEIKAEEYLNGWKRAQADYQNLVKDTDKKVAQLREFCIINHICEILPILEHFQTAVSHIPEESKNLDWVRGFVLIKNEMEAILAKLEVKRIDVVGLPFDPIVCEAVSQEESEGAPPNTVIKEVSAGYKKGDKVIVPARVVVSK